jgi:single-strand DNA-binding protein
MARSLNKAMLIGNLGSDPDVRTTSDGTKVVGFPVATNRAWIDRDGNQQERTEWHRIVGWGSLAEIAERYLTKGDRVYVEGEIQYRSYEDRDGTTRFVTEIRARELVMLGGREGNGSGDSSTPRQPEREAVTAGAAAATESFDSAGDLDDDDLPF